MLGTRTTKPQSFIQDPMAILQYTVLLLAFVCFLFLFHWRRNKHQAIINWPLVGMLPGVVRNAQHFHEYTTELIKHHGGTWMFKGPWFTDMHFVFTSDPENINHILCRNFSNYNKGTKFREIFDALGDGIFTADSDWWRFQRRLILSLLNEKNFQMFSEKVSRGKVESGLIPVLDHVAAMGAEVDLQDVFLRFTFDNVCSQVLGFDPNCLSIEFPEVGYANAFDKMEEGAFYRHLLPECYWKLQRWLHIGMEKKVSESQKIFDLFLYQCISSAREKLSRSRTQKIEEENFDLLTTFMRQEADVEMDDSTKSDRFMKDLAFSLINAGRDTIGAGLTWLLWLVTTHPLVEAKILEEIKEHLLVNNQMKWDSNVESNLVYLHGAICEGLRLFPPVPFEHRHTVQSDTLPSGHRVVAGEMMLYSLYAMGRMESIWGEDCLEFKPERWISGGRILHVPSYKFIAFNAGPRTCIGKNISFSLMKMVASTILWNYEVRVVEKHPVLPSNSIVIHMRYGLKVKISKRCI